MGIFDDIVNDASSIYTGVSTVASDIYTGALDTLSNSTVMAATNFIATFGTSAAEYVSASDVIAPEIGVPLAAGIEGLTLLAKGASRLELGASAIKKKKLNASDLLNLASSVG